MLGFCSVAVVLLLLLLLLLFIFVRQRRNIQPSLFVGTRGVMSSSAAYLLGGPSNSDRHLRFREMMRMPLDGAVLAVDWELPHFKNTRATNAQRKHEILHGPIQQPVVLVLHGLNNHAHFGYVRSMMRTCVKRGWVAVGLNMRGCGGVEFQTPRGYNGAYTGGFCSRLAFRRLFIPPPLCL